MDFLQIMTDVSRPEVAKKPWMEEVTMRLVTDEMLDEVVAECMGVGHYGLDLETTGLDNRVFDGRTKDQIAGVCLSPNVTTGYYIPMRHKAGDCNLRVERVEDALRKLVNAEAVPVFHNAKFDQEFLAHCGGAPVGTWDSPSDFEDTYL